MKSSIKPKRFANTAIPLMVTDMEHQGANRTHMTAKIVGGASMFTKTSTLLQIGQQNITAVKQTLKKLHIRIVAEDIGGNQGRSVWFDTNNGDVVVSHSHGTTTMI